MTAAAPALRRRPRRPRLVDRVLLYTVAVILALWTLIPIYLVALAAFSERSAIYEFPKPLLPTRFSTDTMSFFVNSTGVLPSVRNSIIVAISTILLGLVIGAPADTPSPIPVSGRDGFQVGVLVVEDVPDRGILSIPLAVTFIRSRLYDNLIAVILVHTAMVLPFIVIVTRVCSLRSRASSRKRRRRWGPRVSARSRGSRSRSLYPASRPRRSSASSRRGTKCSPRRS